MSNQTPDPSAAVSSSIVWPAIAAWNIIRLNIQGEQSKLSSKSLFFPDKKPYYVVLSND